MGAAFGKSRLLRVVAVYVGLVFAFVFYFIFAMDLEAN